MELNEGEIASVVVVEKRNWNCVLLKVILIVIPVLDFLHNYTTIMHNCYFAAKRPEILYFVSLL